MSQGKSNFAALLDELETLQKAFPNDDDKDGAGTGEEDDKKIQAAADGDVDGDGVKDGADPDTAGKDGEGKDNQGDEVFGKSFKVVLENGEEVEAFDGGELVKALMAQTKDLKAQAVNTEEAMNKALTAAVATMQGMEKMLKAQAAEIADLKKSLGDLANQGRGRKAVVSVIEKPGPGDADKEADGLNPQEFMTKALAAQRAGRITGQDVAVAESYLGRGMAPPERIVSRVLTGS